MNIDEIVEYELSKLSLEERGAYEIRKMKARVRRLEVERRR